MTSSPRLAGRVFAAAALACVTVLVTACGGSSSPAAGATKTVTAAPAAPASPAAPATAGAATSAPAASPAVPAGPGPCATRYLHAKLGIAQGTAGSMYQVLDFTNIGTVSCTLYGYPGVSFAGGTPVSQIGLAAAESKLTARKLVTLAPGAVANALLQIVHAANYPASRCNLVTADYLQIYPPDQTTPLYLSYTSQTCSKPVQILTVSVMQPGSGSSS